MRDTNVMLEYPVMAELSEFQRFILTQIVAKIHEQPRFHLYEIIRDAIVHKDVSSFPEKLVIETYHAIDNYLTENDLLTELKASRTYDLTEKGKQLLTLRALEDMNKNQRKDI